MFCFCRLFVFNALNCFVRLNIIPGEIFFIAVSMVPGLSRCFCLVAFEGAGVVWKYLKANSAYFPSVRFFC